MGAPQTVERQAGPSHIHQERSRVEDRRNLIPRHGHQLRDPARTRFLPEASRRARRGRMAKPCHVSKSCSDSNPNSSRPNQKLASPEFPTCSFLVHGMDDDENESKPDAANRAKSDFVLLRHVGSTRPGCRDPLSRGSIADYHKTIGWDMCKHVHTHASPVHGWVLRELANALLHAVGAASSAAEDTGLIAREMKGSQREGGAHDPTGHPVASEPALYTQLEWGSKYRPNSADTSTRDSHDKHEGSKEKRSGDETTSRGVRVGVGAGSEDGYRERVGMSERLDHETRNGRR